MDFNALVSDDAEAPDYRLIELLFFGYRDFIGIADAALTAYGYGRAHHRVLHFVHRNPGLTVGELLAILKISKQAAARVIKTLTDDGMIITHPGEDDRRERHLTTTGKGATLATQLSQLQSERIRAAIADLPADSRDAVERFLMRLVEPAERLEVERLTDNA
ncbi:MAG: MarR family transcriptional regulator [Pseudomonadota bacterium]